MRPQRVQPIARGLIAVGVTLKHARSGKLRPVGSDWERFALEDIRNGLLTYEALVTWFNEDTADRLFAEAGVESLAAQLFKQAQIDAELHDADEGDSSD